MDVPLAMEDRTGVPAIHRHDDIGDLDRVRGERLGELLRQIESGFLHRGSIRERSMPVGASLGLGAVASLR
ncbi:MAG TPA: hypothetical protein VEM93_01200, partial [Actinomycetota bacterium]|nr:hypothetical protein [Actinomycetota bacterium]